MFYKAFKAQFLHILRQRSTQLVFFVLLGFVSINFVGNVLEFQGADRAEMYDPMKLLLLSYNRVNYNAEHTLQLVQLYPLLVAFPAGLTLAKERDLGLNVLIESRIGSRSYKFSKLAAVFLATACVFTVPFLLEIALNCIAFPLDATKDLSHRGIYETEYIQSVKNYWLYELYIKAPRLYAIAMTTAWGIISGVLGAFTMAFSEVVLLRFRILYLLPVFILLSGTAYLLPDLNGGSMEHVWYKYMLIYSDSSKNVGAFVGVLVALIGFSLIATLWSSRKDCLK